MHLGTSQDRTAASELIGFSRTPGKRNGTGRRSQGQRASGTVGGGRAAVGRGLAASMALAAALLAGCDAEPGSLWRSPLGMEFAWIPAGKFEMGSPEGEAGPDGDERQHEVTLSQGFWMGRYEVTQGEWEAVMGSNPSYFHVCGSRCPVEFVSWDEVQEFIRSLNARESGRGYRYRLPTEAEWEYAARAGSMGATPEGELRILGERNVPVLDGQAWYGGNSGVSYEGGASLLGLGREAVSGGVVRDASSRSEAGERMGVARHAGERGGVDGGLVRGVSAGSGEGSRGS